MVQGSRSFSATASEGSLPDPPTGKLECSMVGFKSWVSFESLMG